MSSAGRSYGGGTATRTCIWVCEVWRESIVLCSSAARSAAADSSPSSPVATSCIVCSGSSSTVSALRRVRAGSCPACSRRALERLQATIVLHNASCLELQRSSLWCKVQLNLLQTARWQP
jgi:hypothetical protein